MQTGHIGTPIQGHPEAEPLPLSAIHPASRPGAMNRAGRSSVPISPPLLSTPEPAGADRAGTVLYAAIRIMCQNASYEPARCRVPFPRALPVVPLSIHVFLHDHPAETAGTREHALSVAWRALTARPMPVRYFAISLFLSHRLPKSLAPEVAVDRTCHATN
jgi:hypothetical protein